MTKPARQRRPPRPASGPSRLIQYDGLASEAMGVLTTGVFLAGYAVEIGASNAAIGLLAALPFAVQLLQLPAVALVGRLRKRRAICTWAAGIGRCFLLAASVAALLGPSAGMAAIGLMAVHKGRAAIGGCAWNSWMRDLVPVSEYGRFFGRRTAAMTALASWRFSAGSRSTPGRMRCPAIRRWAIRFCSA